MRASGTFEVKLAPAGNDSTPEGPNLGRMSIDKTFTGELTGLTGKMDIIIDGKEHTYVFEYSMTKQ